MATPRKRRSLTKQKLRNNAIFNNYFRNNNIVVDKCYKCLNFKIVSFKCLECLKLSKKNIQKKNSKKIFKKNIKKNKK